MTAKNICHLIQPFGDRYNDYLTDESRIRGTAQSISFPENETQVQSVVKKMLVHKTPITVQGSRTGMTGGAVPCGGHILNLLKMNRVTGLALDQEGQFSVRVQPGLSLSQLNQMLDSGHFDCDGWDNRALAAQNAFKKAKRLFWPPDPTERSASIGGIAANNAQGICALYYGRANRHINGLRMVDARAEIQSIPRGRYIFSHGICPLPDGSQIRLDQTSCQTGLPDNWGDQYDLLDLYLGSQGMFGVMTELSLSLQPFPREMWGIVFFFGEEAFAIEFIQGINALTNRQVHTDQGQKTGSGTDIVAIEVMDQTTLGCIRDYKQVNSRLKGLPDWDNCLTTAVYMEIHGSSATAVESISESLLETAVRCGGDPDNTWAFCGEREIERLRRFRHAAAESVGLIIDRARQNDSRITRLGTDMYFQDGALSERLDLYRRDMDAHGLKAAVFGHAGNGHLHVNILPQTYQQFKRGKTLINEWTKRDYATNQGLVVTDHGQGKNKNSLSGAIELSRQMNIFCSVKKQLDPDGLWNPGNMQDSCEQ